MFIARSCRRHSQFWIARLLVITGGLWTVPSTAVAAESVCVRCIGPFAMYVCVPPAVKGVSGQFKRRALGFLCTQQIAQANGHQSCQVKLNNDEPCDGPSFTISAQPSPQAGNASKQSAAKPKPRDNSNSEPKTVVELAKRTAKASKEQLKKTGKAIENAGKKVTGTIKDAAKSTWRCLTSLFTDC